MVDATDDGSGKITFSNLEDEIFGNVSGDIAIAAGGAATIQANSVALGTDTTGDYVSTITAGTGLTSTGATSGEGIAHSLSVDAAQTQITSVGALDGGSITSGFGSIDVGSSAITTTGTVTGGTLAGTLSTAAQTNITSVGVLTGLEIATSASDSGVDLTLNGNKSSNGAVASIIFENASDSVAMIRASRVDGNNDAAAMQFFTQATGGSNAERMRISSAGNLSIQTTAVSSDGINLNTGLNYSITEGANSSFTNLFRQASSAATVLANGYRCSSNANAFASSYASSWAKSAVSLNYGTIRFYTDTAATTAVGTDVTPTERMRIDSSGNVGIGDTSPDRKLHVNSGNTNECALFESTDTEVTLELKDTTGTAKIKSRHDFRFEAGDSEKMRLDSSGNIDLLQSNHLRWKHAAGGTIRASIDADSNDNLMFYTGSSETQRVSIDSNGNLGLGGTASGGSPRLNLYNDDSLRAYITTSGTSLLLDSDSGIIFNANNTEVSRFDSSGTFMVGKTTSGVSTVGAEVRSGSSNYSFTGTSSGHTVQLLNRTSDDGDLLEFRQDNSKVGSIGVIADHIVIADGDTGLKFDNGFDAIVPASETANRDNAIDLGASTVRFDDIYATNGTIQTSDRNEKQDEAAISEAEKKVAVAAKGLLKKFKFKSAVTDKGSDARIHFGIVAQDLEDAFTAEGLDASDYAMWCSDTWTDDDGKKQTRLGVRYSELLAFIIAGI